MATVTGLTADRMLAIEAASVVSGQVVADDLILTKHDGSSLNAGNVRGPQGVKGDKGDTGSVTAISAWPVGSIFLSVVSTNPSILLGGGTWAAWGTGRVPVAIDTSQAEFNGSEVTGGEKKHTLTVAEMPAHNHGGSTGNDSPDHTHGQKVTALSSGSADRRDWDSDGASSPFSQGVNTYGASDRHQHSISTQGSGTAHNNLQPYITCYMWKRTA